MCGVRAGSLNLTQPFKAKTAADHSGVNSVNRTRKNRRSAQETAGKSNKFTQRHESCEASLRGVRDQQLTGTSFSKGGPIHEFKT